VHKLYSLQQRYPISHVLERCSSLNSLVTGHFIQLSISLSCFLCSHSAYHCSGADLYFDPQIGHLYPPSITVVLTCVFWPSGRAAVPTHHSAGLLPPGRLLQPRPDGLQRPTVMCPCQPGLPGGGSTECLAVGREPRHSGFSQVDVELGFVCVCVCF